MVDPDLPCGMEEVIVASPWWGVCLQWSSKFRYLWTKYSNFVFTFSSCHAFWGLVELVVVKGSYDWGDIKIFVLTISLIVFCPHCQLSVLYCVLKLHFPGSLASCLPVRFCQWEAFTGKWNVGGQKKQISSASVLFWEHLWQWRWCWC